MPSNVILPTFGNDLMSTESCIIGTITPTVPVPRLLGGQNLSFCRVRPTATGRGMSKASLLPKCLSCFNAAPFDLSESQPNRIIPVSAHAAFDKAGAYFNIKIHHIAVDPITRKVDLKRVARAM